MYFNWLDNIQDWCISRQLWWGHRIPVWYVDLEDRGHHDDDNRDQDQDQGDNADGRHGLDRRVRDGRDSYDGDGGGDGGGDIFVVARNEAEAMEKAEALLLDVERGGGHRSSSSSSSSSDGGGGDGLGGRRPSFTLRQETDVLDTWFSSALWPASTLGWPGAMHGAAGSSSSSGSDYDRFYPTNLMETGYDILFFWVARMHMMCLELTGKAPFDTVYLHGLVRDQEGRKMSKTTGNVIDPMDVAQTNGADALRYSLVTGTTPGQDVSLSMDKIGSNLHFVNKLWNIGRLVCMHASPATAAMAPTAAAPAAGIPTSSQRGAAVLAADQMTPPRAAAMPLAERYIVSRCHQVQAEVTALLDDPTSRAGLGVAGRLVHDFVWHEFADWYVEVSKTRLQSPPSPPSSSSSSSLSSGGNDGGTRGAEPAAAVATMDADNEAAQATQATQATLTYVFDVCLRLLHPYMPFATEALWQRLYYVATGVEATGDNLLALAQWPGGLAPLDDAAGGGGGGGGGGGYGLHSDNGRGHAGDGGDASERRDREEARDVFLDESAVAHFRALQEVVTAVRSVRSEHGAKLSQPIRRILIAVDDAHGADDAAGGAHGATDTGADKSSSSSSSSSSSINNSRGSLSLFDSLASERRAIAALVRADVGGLALVRSSLAAMADVAEKAETTTWGEDEDRDASDGRSTAAAATTAATTVSAWLERDDNVHLNLSHGIEVVVSLEGLVDVAKERARLEKQAKRLAGDIEGLQKRLAAKGFIDKAPAAKVQETRDTLAEKEELLVHVQGSLADLANKLA